jgi:hypothetical protein
VASDISLTLIYFLETENNNLSYNSYQFHMVQVLENLKTSTSQGSGSAKPENSNHHCHLHIFTMIQVFNVQLQEKPENRTITPT